jgi:carbonic anhydrase/acetyltransferase-like protein (isoleucine patch superfamily)
MFWTKKPQGRKYNLISVGTINNPVKDMEPQKMFRLEALRDIPEHGVKKGDLGGFVQEAESLSHEGSCWVGGQAQIVFNVRISGDAYIGDNAVIDGEGEYCIYISDGVRIDGNAQILAWERFDSSKTEQHVYTLKGNIHISDDAMVKNLKLGAGNAVISEKAKVFDADEISGFSTVSGWAKVLSGAKIQGRSIIADDAVIECKTVVRDATLRGNAETSSVNVITGDNALGFHTQDNLPVAIASEETKMLTVLRDVMASISSYENDIVKIIKYPVMTDRTDEFTRKMASALKNAQRLSANPADPEFKDSVFVLEDAFLAAESNAIKIASTLLSEAEKKKTELAKDLLNVASDEGATEHERKIAFRQAFKTLEGVLTVPEKSMDVFRIKIGLKELES